MSVAGTRLVHLVAHGVLFDSDGVLVDSHEQVEAAWLVLAAEFDLDYDVLARQLVGVPASQTLARHLSGERLERAVGRLEELEIETAATTRPVAGAAELLERLPIDRWAIVTSASRRLGIARWRGAGLPSPRHSITFDDVSTGKPAPDPFLAGASLLGIAPEACLAFEDSSSGGIAASAAGATVVAVGAQPWRTSPAARIADLAAVETVAVDGRHLVLTLRAEVSDIG